MALSRISGLVREVLMAGLFGAGMAYDAFLLGFRVPNLARDLFAEGALSSAFVPTFTAYLARSRREAAELANQVTAAVFLVIGVVCLAGIFLSPAIVSVMAPGFSEVPGKSELAVHLMRIMFPFLLLVALAAQAMGILNSCNQFGVPALSSTFFNLGSVAFGLALGFWWGPSLGISQLEGMAYGVVIGGALQLAWQLPALWRAGFAFKLRFDWSHPGLRHIVRLMGPAILGGAAVQVNIVVNTIFASQIVDPVRGMDGPTSWLNYAFRFMQLPLGLFGVSIAAATLPSISRSIASGDMEEYRTTLARSLGMVFLLTIPSSVGLMVLGETMIGAVYQSGRFEVYDTRQTALALSYYAIGLSGYAALKVLAPAFYALGDARTPMMVSVLSIGMNLGLATMLVYVWGMGHAGLALSTSLVAVSGFAVLFAILHRRIGGIHGWHLLGGFSRTLVAATMMGVAAAGIHAGLVSFLGISKLGRLLDVVITVPVGLIVFYLAARLMRVPELTLALRGVYGLFGKLPPVQRATIE